MNQASWRPVIPIYLVGVTWLIHSLIFPLYELPHFILCAVESLIVYFVARHFCRSAPEGAANENDAPEAQMSHPDPQTHAKPEQTQQPEPSPEVAALLKERDRALSEMRRLNDAIEDPKISEQIDHLETVTGKILSLVAEEPQKLPQIRRFLDYYLPTTLKILNAYDRMGATGIQGSNINATKQKVERIMDTIVVAFDRQLDALFQDDALDISTDITFMENLLAQEGLSQSPNSANPEDTPEDPIQLQF